MIKSVWILQQAPQHPQNATNKRKAPITMRQMATVSNIPAKLKLLKSASWCPTEVYECWIIFLWFTFSNVYYSNGLINTKICVFFYMNLYFRAGFLERLSADLLCFWYNHCVVRISVQDQTPTARKKQSVNESRTLIKLFTVVHI